MFVKDTVLELVLDTVEHVQDTFIGKKLGTATKLVIPYKGMCAHDWLIVIF